MSLFLNLVCGLMFFEMGLFSAMTIPFPPKIRKPILSIVSLPFKSIHFQVAYKCILGFILILFIDSVNKVIKVSSDLTSFDSAASSALGNNSVDRTDILLRRFYAQRNMYICGFTLFLTLILSRTYALVDEVMVLKEQRYSKVANSADAADPDEVSKLKAQLTEKEENIQILKKQAEHLSKDYEELIAKKPKNE
ncbi:hypothetical protein LJB42_001404 [Komagataella kurtzmanii]|nr:hypothetical protein LJB42_001404 [Komagataella kurtzmanii]